jgi:hypothetical protein
VNTHQQDKQGYPDIAFDDEDNFLITWESDNQDGDKSGLFGQYFKKTGERVGAEFQINTHTQDWQEELTVAAGPPGKFVVAYMDWAQSLGLDGDEVFARMYNFDEAKIDESEMVRKSAIVEKIDILLLESFPLQVHVVASGHLPDSCTKLHEGMLIVRGEGNEPDFNIALHTIRDKNESCAQVITPFSKNIPLDVYGLPFGTYTVDVNGIKDSFEFTVDNVPQTP